MASRGWTMLALALMVMTPIASAQIDNPDTSTPTTLYFHIWDTFGKFVINTQPYNATAFETGGVNFPTTDGTVLNSAPGGLPVEASAWDFNTIYGYSTAGPVEYEFTEAGKPRIHPERGIAQDVLVDASVDPKITLYIDARGLFGGDETPSYMPQLTFRATMREGDDAGADLNEGPIIMDGRYTVNMFDARWCPPELMSAAIPVTWVTCPLMYDAVYGGQTMGLPGAGAVPLPGALGSYDSFPASDPAGVPILYPDENNVIAVEIPLAIASTSIPRDEAYNIRLDWYQEVPVLTSGEDEFSQGNLRMVLADDYRPRLEMNIMNPVYISFIHPQVAAGTLLIHTGVNSPWGTYDVDETTLEIAVNGPTEPQDLQRVVAKNQHVHGLHHLDAEITYLWKFRDEGAANGDYTIDYAVSNVAGTSTARGHASFTIEGARVIAFDEKGDEVIQPEAIETSEGSPAPFLGVLALLGLALRRRA